MRTTNSMVRCATGASVASLLIAGMVSSPQTHAAEPKKHRASTVALRGTGALVLDGMRTYRLDPTKKLRRGGYGPPVVMPDGPNGARAAYVLTQYGVRGDRLQAAAVDVALRTLLSGRKRYALQGGATARWLQRLTPRQRFVVRGHVREMLAVSQARAGGHRIVVQAPTVAAGTPATVRVSVRDSRGGAMAWQPVTVAYAGTSQQVSTDQDGVATAQVTAVAGDAPVTATVPGMRSTQVSVRAPVGKHASRRSPVVLSGQRGPLVGVAALTGRVAQTLDVTGTDHTVVGSVVTGQANLRGGLGTRGVGHQVVGGGTGVPACTPTNPNQFQVSAPGALALPPWAPVRSGWYRRAVTVGGNTYTDPVTACSSPFRVRTRTAVFQGSSHAKVDRGTDFRTTYQVGGFDRVEGHTVVTRFYGPDGGLYCNRSLMRYTVEIPGQVAGNGVYTSAAWQPRGVDVVGTWVAETVLMDEDGFMMGSASNCAVVGQVR